MASADTLDAPVAPAKKSRGWRRMHELEAERAAEKARIAAESAAMRAQIAGELLASLDRPPTVNDRLGADDVASCFVRVHRLEMGGEDATAARTKLNAARKAWKRQTASATHLTRDAQRAAAVSESQGAAP